MPGPFFMVGKPPWYTQPPWEAGASATGWESRQSDETRRVVTALGSTVNGRTLWGSNDLHGTFNLPVRV